MIGSLRRVVTFGTCSDSFVYRVITILVGDRAKLREVGVSSGVVGVVSGRV